MRKNWPVWLCAGACVAIIVVQSVAFAKLCYKNAPLVGLSKAECTKSFKCGMVIAVGPSLSCFIGAISMITVVGGPLAWMRLSMIGAAPTERHAASSRESRMTSRARCWLAAAIFVNSFIVR